MINHHPGLLTQPADEGMRMIDHLAVHKSIATSIPEIIRLECGVCGIAQPCNWDQTVTYLRNGWPKCCGYTMSLITENDTRRAKGA